MTLAAIVIGVIAGFYLPPIWVFMILVWCFFTTYELRRASRAVIDEKD